LLALTFAINEEKMWNEFIQVRSVDEIIRRIENKEIE